MEVIKILYPYTEDKEVNVNMNKQVYNDHCPLGRLSLDSTPLTNLTDHGNWFPHKVILCISYFYPRKIPVAKSRRATK